MQGEGAKPRPERVPAAAPVMLQLSDTPGTAMSLPFRLVVLLSCLMLPVAAATARPVPESPPRSALLTADRILDVRSGRMIRGGHVLVRDGRIVEVGQGDGAAAAGADVPRIDLGDMTLLPGLIDMHVHLDSDQPMAATPGTSSATASGRCWRCPAPNAR